MTEERQRKKDESEIVEDRSKVEKQSAHEIDLG